MGYIWYKYGGRLGIWFVLWFLSLLFTVNMLLDLRTSEQLAFAHMAGVALIDTLLLAFLLEMIWTEAELRPKLGYVCISVLVHIMGIGCFALAWHTYIVSGVFEWAYVLPAFLFWNITLAKTLYDPFAHLNFVRRLTTDAE